jgi:hypothetical protein
MNFPRGNAVLAVCQHPHGKQPLVQADSGVFKDSPNLDGKLRFRVPILALPQLPGFKEANVFGTAGRADYAAVLPAPGRKVGDAVLEISEVNCCFLESFRVGCHDESSIIEIA